MIYSLRSLQNRSRTARGIKVLESNRSKLKSSIMTNYYVVVTDNELKIIQSKKKNIAVGINYFIFISIVSFIIFKEIYFTAPLFSVFNVFVVLLSSFSLTYFILSMSKSGLKIQKKGHKIHFDKHEIVIEDIIELVLDEYISSEAITGLTSISLLTKTRKYLLISSVFEIDVQEIVDLILKFINNPQILVNQKYS